MSRRIRRPFSAADDARLRELFAQGGTLDQIGAAMGRDRSVIRKRLLYLGIYGPPRRVSAANRVATLAQGKKLYVPELQRRRGNNAIAEAKFAKLMRGRLFSIRATSDWGGKAPPRPEAFVCSASSMGYADTRERVR